MEERFKEIKDQITLLKFNLKQFQEKQDEKDKIQSQVNKEIDKQSNLLKRGSILLAGSNEELRRGANTNRMRVDKHADFIESFKTKLKSFSDVLGETDVLEKIERGINERADKKMDEKINERFVNEMKIMRLIYEQRDRDLRELLEETKWKKDIKTTDLFIDIYGEKKDKKRGLKFTFKDNKKGVTVINLPRTFFNEFYEFMPIVDGDLGFLTTKILFGSKARIYDFKSVEDLDFFKKILLDFSYKGDMGLYIIQAFQYYLNPETKGKIIFEEDDHFNMIKLIGFNYAVRLLGHKKLYNRIKNKSLTYRILQSTTRLFEYKKQVYEIAKHYKTNPFQMLNRQNIEKDYGTAGVNFFNAIQKHIKMTDMVFPEFLTKLMEVVDLQKHLDALHLEDLNSITVNFDNEAVIVTDDVRFKNNIRYLEKLIHIQSIAKEHKTFIVFIKLGVKSYKPVEYSLLNLYGFADDTYDIKVKILKLKQMQKKRGNFERVKIYSKDKKLVGGISISQYRLKNVYINNVIGYINLNFNRLYFVSGNIEEFGIFKFFLNPLKNSNVFNESKVKFRKAYLRTNKKYQKFQKFQKYQK